MLLLSMNRVRRVRKSNRTSEFVKHKSNDTATPWKREYFVSQWNTRHIDNKKQGQVQGQDGCCDLEGREDCIHDIICHCESGPLGRPYWNQEVIQTFKDTLYDIFKP